MRCARIVGGLVGLALLCLSAVIGVVGADLAAQSQDDSALSAQSLETAGAISEYFERARAIDLLVANTPTMREPFDGASDEQATRNVEDVLGYLERLYPDSIGEACLIDRQGVEVARVVRGVRAAHHELSHEEAQNAFFGAAFALEVGEVYQSDPYVSPDTGEWVISNSTQVTPTVGPSPAIAHFEVTIDSFRRQAERAASVDLMIVDRDTGRIITRTGHEQRDGAELGLPATELSERVRQSPGDHGILSVGDVRASWRALPAAPGNQNHWAVVTSTPATTAFWSTTPGRSAIAAAVGALVLLGTFVGGMAVDRRQLRRRVSTDALTGLSNRTELHRHLGAVLANRREDRRAVVLLLDLDGFKEVNDTLGHHRGDELLREVAQRVRTSVRPGDLTARLGGDEFAVVAELPSQEPGNLEVAVSRLLEAIRRPYRLDDVDVHVNASIGVAVVGDHGDSPELLVQRADVAMYQAKAADLDYVVYDAGTDPHSTHRLGMTAGLLDAIERREIRLVYQPKIDLCSGAVVGVEALIRWTHPTAGPLSPEEFIPMAEKTGLIRPLTQCVLDVALAQCRRWLEEGRHLPVAVNCSAADLVDEHIVRYITDRLEHHGVPASMLRLELTESALMTDIDRASRCLAKLKATGVTIAVDDYGTGYSSLTYLRTLPVSELKIDRAFISAVCESSTDALIVRSTIELGHSLGLDIVAEGVEGAEVLDFLRDAGCDIVQGFHLARPMPSEDLTAWLDEREADLTSPVGTRGSPGLLHRTR